MENMERKDDGSSSRKAVESVPDKALLLPDGAPEKPPGDDENKDLPPVDPDGKDEENPSKSVGK